MEEFLYTVNLAIHNLLLVACAAAPFYQLRMVSKRATFGKRIIYEYDKSIEDLLSVQPKLCFWFIVGLIASGFAFPLIYYAFHGEWQHRSAFVYAALAVKTILVFIGFGIVSYGMFVIDRQIQGLFRQFSPDAQPPQDQLDRFFALRAKRKKFCTVCLYLAAAILVVTPILRFW
ncbi:MAG: hypothetical protein A2Z18_10030 [Armatimonadetes bacterium RBG_16_58_9]|nr:MAG: hypothetical protein A2Z18_10030 [Armatimonadetes bacterium RBG_16_58_9]